MDVGYAPIEASTPQTKSTESKPASTNEDKTPAKVGTWSILKKEVLQSPFVWLLAVTYFFIYIVRQVSEELNPVHLRYSDAVQTLDCCV
jgi:sugar phosphate permease